VGIKTKHLKFVCSIWVIAPLCAIARGRTVRPAPQPKRPGAEADAGKGGGRHLCRARVWSDAGCRGGFGW
jgi:hypothetical protein